MFPRGVIAQRDLEHRRDRQPENSYDYLSYDGEQEQQSLEKREKIHLMGGWIVRLVLFFFLNC